MREKCNKMDKSIYQKDHKVLANEFNKHFVLLERLQLTK